MILNFFSILYSSYFCSCIFRAFCYMIGGARKYRQPLHLSTLLLLSEESPRVPGIDSRQHPTYSSYATPYSATQHPNQLRHTLLTYTTPYSATPHPSQLCHTKLRYATTNLATPHPSQLRHTKLSYSTPYTATPHPTQLCHTKLIYATP